MKTKTIKAVIRKKVDSLLASIDDPLVRDLLAKNIIVTGGCIASMLLKEKVNDFDIYFKTREAAVAAAFYYMERFHVEKKNGIDCKIWVANGFGQQLKKEDYSFIPAAGEIDNAEAPIGNSEPTIETDEKIDQEWTLPGSSNAGSATYASLNHKKKAEDIDLRKRVKIYIKSAGVASSEGAEKPYEYFEGRAAGEAGAYLDEVMNGGDAESPNTDVLGDIIDKEAETKTALEQNAKPTYRPLFVTSNAISLSDHVQLILRFFGKPDDIHGNYDFAHCTNYWQSWNNELVLRPEALEALMTRELVYFGSRYPICSLIRVRKFVARGWTVNAGQILKMVFQVGDLNLKDPKVLEDQLTGVDVAYFAEMISKIKADDPQKINTSYLIELLNRLF